LGVTTPSRVTVVAPDCTTADALASALSVLGPPSMELLHEFPATAALIVRVDDGQERTYESPGMGEYVLKE
jgi:thiamine biosynthesis lipoprotein